MKLKKLLEHTLGELPSEKSIKMKWNPVNESEPVNEASGLPLLLQQDRKAKAIVTKALIQLDNLDTLDGETVAWIVKVLGFEVKGNQIVGR